MIPRPPEPNQQEGAKLVRDVVRGERHWNDLTDIGVVLNRRDATWTIVYAGHICAMPDIADLAMGFRAYRERPYDLQAWAQVLLAGSAFLDFGGIESTEAGEALIEGLWEAADSGTLNAIVEKIIARLTD